MALAKCAATSLVASTSKTLVCCTSCLGGRRPSNGLPKSGRGAPLKTARRNQAQSVAGGPFEDGQAQEGSPFLLTTTNSINSGDQQIETKLARNLRCRGLVHWRTRGGFDVSYAAPARAVRKMNSCSKLLGVACWDTSLCTSQAWKTFVRSRHTDYRHSVSVGLGRTVQRTRAASRKRSETRSCVCTRAACASSED